MGSVWLALDGVTGREVAVKRMLPELAASRDALARFRAEFLAMRRLRHEALTEALDFGWLDDGSPYFTMEVLPGPGLDACMPLEPEAARKAMIEALGALAHLHGHGLLHHDLKPENLRLGEDGRLRLMDLGLLGPIGEVSQSLRGTPRYVSPEAARGEALDPRSDLYALGAVFYHLLAGRPPFEAQEALDLLEAHQHAVPDPLALHAPATPPDLGDLVMALLSKSPLRRPQSAQEALERLGVAPSVDREPALVGRDPVLATLNGYLQAERRGPEAVTLVGPGGSGKTRILEDWASETQVEGWVVLRASTSRATAEPGSTLASVRRGLESLAQDRAPETWAALQAERGELEPRATALRLQADWERLIEVAAPDRRLVLLVDDWDTVDEASRELLGALVRRGRAPFLIVAASQREAIGTEIPLEPLPLEAAAILVSRMLGTPHPFPAFVEGLWRLSQGSPLLLKGLVLELADGQRLLRQAGEWQTDRVDLESLDLPADTRALATRRLAGLGPDARRLAEAMAIARRPSNPLDLGRWIGLERLQEALQELVSRGLVVTEDPLHRLESPLLAAVLREALPPDECALLSEAIAQGLSLPGSEASDAELAILWAAVGAMDRAVPLAIASARRRLDSYCLSDAERLVRLALDYSGLDGAARSEALAIAGDLARYRAEFEAAQAAYEEAIALRQGLVLPVSRLRVNLALVLHMQSRFERAHAEAETSAREARDEGLPGEAARALTTLARLRHYTGDPAGAKEACDQALAFAREAGSRELEAEALGFLGYLQVSDPSGLEAALTTLEASMRIREELGDALGLNDAYMLLGNAQMALGRYPEAQLSFTRNLTLCRDVGAAKDDEATARINLAQVSAELGEFTEALAQVSAAVGLAKSSGNRFLEAYALALRARIGARLDQAGQAKTDVKAALALAEALSNPYLEIVAQASRSLAFRLAGDGPEAREAARRGLALIEETGIGEYAIDLHLAETEAHRVLHAPTEAAAAIAAAHRLATERRASGKLAEVALLQARLSLEAAQPEEASRWLEEALLLATGAGMRPLLAEAQLVEGILALFQGRTREAIRLLRSAQAALTELGLLGPADEAMRLIRETQAAPASGGPATGIGDVIADFGRMVTGTLRYEEVLDRVIDQVMEITGADRGMIMLLDGSGALSGLVTRPLGEASGNHLMAFSRTFAQAALTERKSIWVADAQADARFAAAQSVMALDLRTVICVPLIVDEAPIGLLYLDQQSINRTFRADDLRLVEGLAGFAALAIANARRFEEAQERNAILSAVQAIAKLVTAAPDRDRVLRVIVEQALSVSRAERGVILWRDPVRPALALGVSGEPVEPRWDAELIDKVDRTGQAVLSLEVPDADGPQTVMALPFLADARFLGILVLSAGAARRAFTPSDLGVMEALVAQAATALDALRAREAQEARIERLEKALKLVEDQQEAANLDPLTGIFGPAYFTGRLRDEVREAARYGHPVSLLVVDPRRMGELNERFGRQAGDGVLGRVASELKAVSRQTDVVARIGGDEFAVLLPKTPAEGANRVAERLRRELEDLALLDAEGREVWTLKGAMAAVEWRSPEAPESLLERALEALKSI